jgi:phospholipid/cholesterol/gamma-HCH transport system substrate-binding protein
MTSTRSVLLGLFFLITLGVVGYFTLFLTDFSWFKKPNELRVYFSDTNGLREGDSVLVAGMRWGRVKKLVYDPDAPNERRIRMDAMLNETVVLREGFSIQIADATLLGGRNVEIEPGPAGAPLVPLNSDLVGKVAPNPLDAISELVSSSQKGVEAVIDDVQSLTQGVREGKGLVGRLFTDEKLSGDVAEAVASAAKTTADLQLLTANLRAGQGTFGQLLVNDALYTDLAEATKRLNGALTEISALATDLRTGQGLAGRLINDEAIADDLAAAVANVREMTAKINAGGGTLGMLLHDDEIARNVATLTRQLAQGEGTIGALISKPDVYDNLLQISEDFSTITAQMRGGQGSIGRLIMDDEIYQQIRSALQVVQRSLEEYREAAPITTFTSVFFSAF